MTGMGMPSLSIAFRQSAQEVSDRTKQGIVGLVLRDGAESAQGLWTCQEEGDLPAALGAANLAYAKTAFVGSALGTPSRVVVAVVGEENIISLGVPDAGEEDQTARLKEGLALLANVSLDYLAGPPGATEGDRAVMVEWVKAQRDKYRPVKGVLPETPADHMGIINVNMDGAAAAQAVYTSAGLCARVAGILAGTPAGCSATGVTLPELTAAGEVEDPDGAVDGGQFILVHDGLKVKTGRAVNSLQTVPPNGSEDWKKIKIVEGMDLITYYLRTSVEDWRGKYPNDYDHQCLLLSAISEFFTELEGTVIQAGSGWCEIDVAAKRAWLKANGTATGDMSEGQIKEADSGSHVFIAFGAQLLDAMEDFVFRGELG